MPETRPTYVCQPHIVGGSFDELRFDLFLDLTQLFDYVPFSAYYSGSSDYREVAPIPAAAPPSV
jgi:hypothetical protein